MVGKVCFNNSVDKKKKKKKKNVTILVFSNCIFLFLLIFQTYFCSILDQVQWIQSIFSLDILAYY